MRENSVGRPHIFLPGGHWFHHRSERPFSSGCVGVCDRVMVSFLCLCVVACKNCSLRMSLRNNLVAGDGRYEPWFIHSSSCDESNWACAPKISQCTELDLPSHWPYTRSSHTSLKSLALHQES